MKKAAPWLFLLILAGGFAAWYLSQRPPPEQHPSVMTPAELPETTLPEQPTFPVVSGPEEAVPEPEPLPSLAQSDAAIAEALSGIVGAERLGSVFILEQMISRFVSLVDSLDSRQVAPLVMPVRPPAGKFLVQGEDEAVMHPDNTLRYEPYFGIVEAADTRDVAALYRKYYPLFQQAYEELGYRGRYFNDRLVAIIDHLLATPATPPVLELVKSESIYEFADQRLEALSAGQKILLRMGAEKRRVVAQKLQEFRDLLTGGA